MVLCVKATQHGAGESRAIRQKSLDLDERLCARDTCLMTRPLRESAQGCGIGRRGKVA